MSVVGGIVATGEMFLVTSTAGLLAVALVNGELCIQEGLFNAQVDRKANRVVVAVKWLIHWLLRWGSFETKVTNLLLPSFTTVARICSSLSLLRVDLWPRHAGS